MIIRNGLSFELAQRSFDLGGFHLHRALLLLRSMRLASLHEARSFDYRQHDLPHDGGRSTATNRSAAPPHVRRPHAGSSEFHEQRLNRTARAKMMADRWPGWITCSTAATRSSSGAHC